MSLVKPITPHLWFDTQAKEAAAFYCEAFPESKLDYLAELHGTPSGDCDVVAFTLWGQPFMAISAGPHFTPNPSISFFVNFDPARMPDARERLYELWTQLADGGEALMPLDEYPFSKRYGWVQDRYGISWQLMLADPAGDPRPPIVPCLMFAGDAAGQARDAGAFYRSVFDDSLEGQWVPHPAGGEWDREGSTLFSDFRIDRTWMVAMDSAYPHGFGFNEAISFIVHCRDQAELDRYWTQLSSVPEAEQCGWCKDRFGVSWQVSPAAMDAVMASGDQAAIDRVTRAFLPMKKLDVAVLEAAARG